MSFAILCMTIMFIAFVIGSVQIFQQYQFILEYKRYLRTVDEYEKKNKEELMDIVADPDQAGF